MFLFLYNNSKEIKRIDGRIIIINITVYDPLLTVPFIILTILYKRQINLHTEICSYLIYIDSKNMNDFKEEKKELAVQLRKINDFLCLACQALNPLPLPLFF